MILRVVRGHYPHARVVAWGPAVNEPGRARRLELVLLEPNPPDAAALGAMRRELAASDIPLETDIRALADLTLAEQEEALGRGEELGG